MYERRFLFLRVYKKVKSNIEIILMGVIIS